MCEFEAIAVEVVAIPSMSGLRVTPCDVKAEGQAGENAAAPSGFSPLQGAGRVLSTEQCVYPPISEGCECRPGLGVVAESSVKDSSLSNSEALQLVCGTWSFSGGFRALWHPSGLEPDCVFPAV